VFKKIIAAGAALTIATPGFAADLPAQTYTKAPVMPAAAVYNWTGFYIGGHVGGAWSEAGSTELDPGTGAFPTGTVFDKAHPSGVLGGGQIGYNWQVPSNLVIGIEGEWSWADVKGSETTVSTVTVPARLIGLSSTSTHTVDDYATLAGRLGYAANNWLFFVKGGAAWERGGSTSVATLANGTVDDTSAVANYWRTGFVVGVGVEWGFAPNWSAKLEYDHLDFGSTTVQDLTLTGATAGTVSNVRSTVTAEIVKAGVNYHFNWGMPIVAKY
jgi:outer membrane immunogenic protein